MSEERNSSDWALVVLIVVPVLAISGCTVNQAWVRQRTDEFDRLHPKAPTDWLGRPVNQGCANAARADRAPITQGEPK